MSQIKFQKTFYASHEVYKKLMAKALEKYSGKGALSAYLQSIAEGNVIVLDGDCEVVIKPSRKQSH